MIDAADLAGQAIVTDEVLQIWQCQAFFTAPESGSSVVRYVGKVGPQCKGCGTHKGFSVTFRSTETFTLDDVLAKITKQIEDGGC